MAPKEIHATDEPKARTLRTVKELHRYRFLRHWYRRHKPRLKRADYSFCALGGGVVVLTMRGKLVSVQRH